MSNSNKAYRFSLDQFKQAMFDMVGAVGSIKSYENCNWQYKRYFLQEVIRQCNTVKEHAEQQLKEVEKNNPYNKAN